MACWPIRRGPVRARGDVRAHARDGALAHAADVRGSARTGGDGICANVEFPFPRRLTGEAVAAASGIDPETDPWLPERLVWPLLEIVDAALKEPWLAPLPAPARRAGARRFAAVRHLAEPVRPLRAAPAELVRGVGDGDGARTGRPSCGGGWWRGSASPIPATRLRGACARLRAEPELVGAAAALLAVRPHAAARRPARVLRALGRAPRRASLPAASLAGAVGADRGARRAGRADARERPDGAAGRATACSPPGGRTRASCSSCSAPDVVDARAPGRSTAPARCSPACRPAMRDGPRRRSPARADRSVQIHACHGRARQVEVVRDAILHLLEEDPTLEPRDVIVMCPDIETFAPLIQATFGAGEIADEERADARATGRRTCACGSPTARCARPTRCSASSRGCSSWRRSG